MFKNTTHLSSSKWPVFSGHLICLGMALLMILASCSQNGGHVGDKNGEGDTILRQNRPENVTDWSRVIVQLKVPHIDQMKATGAKLKDPAAVRAMDKKIAAQIAAVADQVLAKVQPAGAELIRRYDTLPLLALKVSPGAVTLLKSIPEVLGIEADTLNRPMR